MVAKKEWPARQERLGIEGSELGSLTAGRNERNERLPVTADRLIRIWVDCYGNDDWPSFPCLTTYEWFDNVQPSLGSGTGTGTGTGASYAAMPAMPACRFA